MHCENPTRMAFRSRPPRPACGQVQHHATTELDEGSSSVVIYQLTSKSQQMGKSSRNAKLSIAKVVCVWPGRDKNHTKVVRSGLRGQRRVSTIGREMIVVWKMRKNPSFELTFPFHFIRFLQTVLDVRSAFLRGIFGFILIDSVILFLLT